MTDDDDPPNHDPSDELLVRILAIRDEMDKRCTPDEQRAMTDVETAWLTIEVQAAINRRALAAGGRAHQISHESVLIAAASMAGTSVRRSSDDQPGGPSMTDQHTSGGPESHLPTFDDMRHGAYGRLGDVEDVLKSDWRRGHGPTPAQSEAVSEARKHIARAKDALNRAAE